jgi:hypothetical protein
VQDEGREQDDAPTSPRRGGRDVAYEEVDLASVVVRRIAQLYHGAELAARQIAIAEVDVPVVAFASLVLEKLQRLGLFELEAKFLGVKRHADAKDTVVDPSIRLVVWKRTDSSPPCAVDHIHRLRIVHLAVGYFEAGAEGDDLGALRRIEDIVQRRPKRD